MKPYLDEQVISGNEFINMKINNLVIGCGISGITIANLLATKGESVLIVEKRKHIGGNCYDFYNKDHILTHKYGPHIFHTDNKFIWKYLSNFTKWTRFRHKVLASINGELYNIPINRNTINKFFNINLKDKTEVKNYLNKIRDKNISNINNSRDAIVSKYGLELHAAFIKNYTKKQWDLYPEELSKVVLQRLPVRYDDNPYYFDDKFQGVPKYGYTNLFLNMLNNKKISILLNQDYREVINEIKYQRLFVSSRIDEFINYKYGKLKYRCINFKFETHDTESFQTNSVINFPNEHKYTRITEMKKLTFQDSKTTTICKEFPSWDGEICYPIPQKEQNELLGKYIKESKKNKKIYFLGRFGLYKYLDMDDAIDNAFKVFRSINNA